MVAEVGDDDTDDAARLLLQRARGRVRYVPEAFRRGDQALADVLGNVAVPAESARRGGRRRACRAGDVSERDGTVGIPNGIDAHSLRSRHAAHVSLNAR